MYDPVVDGNYNEYVQDSAVEYIVHSATINDVFPQQSVPKTPKDSQSVLAFASTQNLFTSNADADKKLQKKHGFSEKQMQESMDIMSDHLVISTFVSLNENPRNAKKLIAGLQMMQSLEGAQRVGKKLINQINIYEKKHGKISYTVTDKGIKDQKNLEHLQSFLGAESKQILSDWKAKKSDPDSVVNHPMFHHALFP